VTGAATARGRSDDRTLVLIRAVVERRDERRGEERKGVRRARRAPSGAGPVVACARVSATRTWSAGPRFVAVVAVSLRPIPPPRVIVGRRGRRLALSRRQRRLPAPSAVTGNAAHPPSSSPSLLSVALAGGHRTEGVRAFRRVGPAATQDGCMSLTRGRQTGQGYGPPVDISGTCGYVNVGPVPEERDTGQEARGEFLSRYLSVFASHLAILLSLCFFPGT